MATQVNQKKIFALVLILAMLAFLVHALVPYIKAIFGALIFYVLFNPLYNWLRKKGLGESVSAVVVMLTTIVCILAPLFVVLSLVLGEISGVIEGARGLIGYVSEIDALIENVSLEEMLNDLFTNMGAFTKNIIVSGIGKASHMLIGVTIMYFLLYFMLVNNKPIKKAVSSVIPFNDKNTERLFKEGKNVTYSVVLSIGVIAALQGTMLAVGFAVAGIPSPILWGIIGGILSFLPVVGTPVVWVPAVIWQFLVGNYAAGIGLLIWGIIIMNSDNVIRPFIQKKVSEMHPLVSVIGVFIGIPYFGILGLIVGPLILSYLILAIKMFEEEYL